MGLIDIENHSAYLLMKERAEQAEAALIAAKEVHRQELDDAGVRLREVESARDSLARQVEGLRAAAHDLHEIACNCGESRCKACQILKKALSPTPAPSREEPCAVHGPNKHQCYIDCAPAKQDATIEAAKRKEWTMASCPHDISVDDRCYRCEDEHPPPPTARAGSLSLDAREDL